MKELKCISREDLGKIMAKLKVSSLNFYYGNFPALKNINLTIDEKNITAIIGPSGCGKSTLLRCFNRMNEEIPNVKIEGDILLDGASIYQNKLGLTELRKKVGMVFQRPNPFPFSVFDNVAYGPRIYGIKNKSEIEKTVLESLSATGLYDELKNKLTIPALSLSAERQQRLCISRLLAVKPEVILLDEPCSSLDPVATLKIEDLLKELKKNYTIIIVTHNMQQAARISDTTAYMLLGDLIEVGKTDELFTNPKDERTEGYLSGKFG